MANENIHGLPRRVPDPIAREVRQRVGYGCVVCGEAFATIEHFDPEFKDAFKHDPDGMTLLCGSHQLATTGGRLTKEQVSLHNKDPHCLSAGHPWAEIHVAGGETPKIELGKTTLSAPIFLRIKSKKLIWFEPSDDPHCPFLFNAIFYAENGETALRIKNNIVEINRENWDVRTKGRKIKINAAHRDILLELELKPPETIRVVRAKWEYASLEVEVKPNGDVRLGRNLISGGSFSAGKIAIQYGRAPAMGRFYNDTSHLALLSNIQ